MIENYIFDYVDEPMLDITRYAASINCKSDKLLNIKKTKNVIIDPLCIFTKNQLLTHYAGLNISDCEIVDKPVIFLGTWYNAWGHLLTDTLSKFWFVNSGDYVTDNLIDCDILYSIEDNNLPTQFYELIEIIGIDKKRLKCIDRPRIYKTVYIPDDSIFVKEDEIIAKKDADRKGGLFFYSTEYLVLIDKIKRKIKRKVGMSEYKSDRIFFTTINSTRFIGLSKIENVFKKMGFKIIKPQETTLVEQLSYLMNATVFCTIEGSVSFNMLFLNPKSDAVIIRKLPYIVPYQFMINEISNAKIIYIDTNMSLFCDNKYPYLGPFLLYPSQKLYNYFDIKQKPHIPILLFIKYILRAIRAQNERKLFLETVNWKIDMYYFDMLNDLFRNSICTRLFVKSINRTQSN